jgi:hypothetical protein
VRRREGKICAAMRCDMIGDFSTDEEVRGMRFHGGRDG